MKHTLSPAGAILVVNPPNVPFTASNLLIEPIDILTIASYLQSLGQAVVVRDMDREQIEAADFARLLRATGPRLVVLPFDYHIPLYTGAAAAGVREMVRQAGAAGVQVALGGRPAAAHPGFFLGELPGAVVIAGEMELALRDLLRLERWSSDALRTVQGIVYRDGGGLKRTPTRAGAIELDALPIPDRSLLDLRRYIDVHSLLSSRGCCQRCCFCPVPAFWGPWRARKPELVVDEIQYLSERCGAAKVLFLDDNAMADRRRMCAIAAAVIDRGLEVSLGCLGTPQSADESTLELMYRAGFRWIHYGAESGSQKVLDRLGKHSHVEEIRAAVAAARGCGFRVRTSWILDPPGADSDDLQRTLDLILETQSQEIRVHYLTLRAGSALASAVGADSDQPPPEQNFHAGLPHTDSKRLSRETVCLGAEKLTRELQQRGYAAVYNPEGWNELLNDRGSRDDLRFVSFCPARYGIGWRR